ncbi:MAG: hypothetical protein BRC28_04005 [Nanohaloarchaea archaeon SW_4_43_9]|nr:MAG: hypothetical protein BRC28_04005 [Nanohaloarchaea archaeon SW_4_43_9]
MLEKYASFCYDQIGVYALEFVDYFKDLRPQLVFVGSLFILCTVLSLMMGLSGFILGITLSIVLPTGVLVATYLYPAIVIKQRASEIRDSLPFATMYMATLAGTGTSMSEVFRNMAEVKQYGEVSKEAEKISKDVETFGMDMSKALQRAAERTPSENFKDLMWGMNHAMTSGGSMKSFLQERSQTLMKDYQRRIESFSEQLSLLVEMYITVVIVGSIVFTSMSAVMSSFTSMSGEFIVLIQILAMFVGLPLVSGMFILMVRGMAPGGIR